LGVGGGFGGDAFGRLKMLAVPGGLELEVLHQPGLQQLERFLGRVGELEEFQIVAGDGALIGEDVEVEDASSSWSRR
jgi:hypothetical protein